MNIQRLSNFSGKNFSKAVNEIYSLTDFNHLQYPNYLNWFYKTNIPRLFDMSGEIIFSLDGFLIKGIIILKNTLSEKKICTFMVDEPYRNQKVGTLLLEESFKYLGTDKPIITIPESKTGDFQYFIDKYDWILTGEINKYYSNELIFNK